MSPKRPNLLYLPGVCPGRPVNFHFLMSLLPLFCLFTFNPLGLNIFDCLCELACWFPQGEPLIQIQQIKNEYIRFFSFFPSIFLMTIFKQQLVNSVLYISIWLITQYTLLINTAVLFLWKKFHVIKIILNKFLNWNSKNG